MLAEYLSSQIFGYLLVVCRVGTIVAFIPGFGEQFVPPRTKIALALLISLMLYPVAPIQALLPDSLSMAARLILIEVTIGVWIGMVARGIMAALQYAGQQIAQMSALAMAFAPPSAFQGASMVSSFLMIGAVAMIFATDTHHHMIEAMLFSYDRIPVGHLPLETMVDQMAKATSMVMYVGISLAGPFFVVGILANIGLGLANKMMQTLPVFLVAASLLIAVGMTFLFMAIPHIMNGFLEVLNSWLKTLTF